MNNLPAGFDRIQREWKNIRSLLATLHTDNRGTKSDWKQSNSTP